MRKPIFTIWEKKNDNIAGTRKQLVILLLYQIFFETITDNENNCLDKCILKIRNTEYFICAQLRVSRELLGHCITLRNHFDIIIYSFY